MKRFFFLVIAFLLAAVILAACSAGSNMVYTGSPKDLLCQVEDLPGQADDFMLREDGISQQTNDSLLTYALDIPGTNEYLLGTGRVDGWLSDFLAVDASKTSLPDEVFCQVVLFKSSAGASLALGWDLPVDQIKFTEMKVNKKVGQDMRADQGAYTDPTGKSWDVYHIQFQYQNLLGNIQTFFTAGSDQQKAIDFTMNVAKNLLNRFEKAPFSNPEPTAQE